MVLPLQMADPDDDLGELLGVGVDLDAGELGRADVGRDAGAAVGGVGDDLLLQV